MAGKRALEWFCPLLTSTMVKVYMTRLQMKQQEKQSLLVVLFEGIETEVRSISRKNSKRNASFVHKNSGITTHHSAVIVCDDLGHSEDD